MPEPLPLLRDAAREGAETIGGREMAQLVARVAHARGDDVAHAIDSVIDVRADLRLRADDDLRGWDDGLLEAHIDLHELSVHAPRLACRKRHR